MKAASIAVGVVALLVAGFIYYTTARDRRAARERDYGACGVVTVREARARLEGISARLDDAARLAAATPQASMSGPVAQIQGLAIEARTGAVPVCMERARYLLAATADLQAESFLAFMNHGDSVAVKTPARVAHFYAARFADEVQAVSSCSPDCSGLPPFDEHHEQSELDREKEQTRYELRRSAFGP